MFKCIAHVEVGQSEKFCSSQLPRICCSRNLPNSQMVDNEFETWAIDFHHYRNKSFIAPAIYIHDSHTQRARKLPARGGHVCE